MNKKISGLGVVGGGKYETVFIAGMGTALQNIEAEKLIVEGMFKGKGVYHTSEIQIEGIAKISDSDFADHLTVSGKAKITANRDAHSTMVCQGSIKAGTMKLGRLHLTGTCHLDMLRASEVHIVESKNDRRLREQISRVDQIVCQKLIAYNLKAEGIRAREVQLYGKCEVGTLICELLSKCEPTCIIGKHIRKNPFADSKERGEAQ